MLKKIDLKKLVSGMTICGVLLVGNTAFADDAGWQYKYTQKWEVDSSTTTTPVSMEGGGVKVCFSGVAYDYRVSLRENDSLNPDEKYSSQVLKKGGDCLIWKDIDSEAGNEELYLTFTKTSSAKDTITVTWYD